MEYGTMIHPIVSRPCGATRRQCTTAALVLALGFPAPAALALSYPCSGANVLQSFTNNSAAGTSDGSIQSFLVPSNIVTIDAAGAQGGVGGFGGGLGVEVAATFSMAAGQTLCIGVGVQGGSAQNGAGGGGGGSFVYAISNGTCASNLAQVSTSGPANLLIAAAGGGGSGQTAGLSGSAPTGAGTAGASAGADGDQAGGAGGIDGNGGAAVHNSGGGGGLLTDGAPANGAPGGAALINGADGGALSGYANGGFGGGGTAAAPGGGGGGYNGGGAGGAFPGGGGGGGGSFSATAPLAPYTQSGVQTGNGAVNVCYPASTPVTLQAFDVE